MSKRPVTVVGAGIFGLWQAFELTRRGHPVTVYETVDEKSVGLASRYAGAMLAPFCEAEASEPAVQKLGLRGIALWSEAYPDVICRGTLVVAANRDRTELARFARMTEGHRSVDSSEIARLEPDLADRFPRGLLFADECHLAPRPALHFLLAELRRMGARVQFGTSMTDAEMQSIAADCVLVDCRGLAARGELPSLRGVRGEMVLVRAPEVALARPVRLLHPRHPLYVVPWSDDLYMVGATVLERDDQAPMTVRSALELLGMAYALHPAFAEATIEELGVGVRPAFPDNMPKAIVRGRRIFVNGAYRHGYLLAPVLAEAVAIYLEDGTIRAEMMVQE